jgi:hypothetical protein
MPKSQTFSRGKLRAANRFVSEKLTATGWVRFDDLPIGETFARKLIDEGLLVSVVVSSPGARRGVRLIQLDSFNRYVAEQQKQQEQQDKPRAAGQMTRPTDSAVP